MTAQKLWYIKTGKAEGSHHVHLVGPVAKAVHEQGLQVLARAKTRLEPTARQAYKDIMLLGYTTSAALAKRFAKIANEIKGKGELPESRNSAAFMLAYARKEAGSNN